MTVELHIKFKKALSVFIRSERGECGFAVTPLIGHDVIEGMLVPTHTLIRITSIYLLHRNVLQFHIGFLLPFRYMKKIRL